MSLVVADMREVARGVHTIELCDPNGQELPPFTPGAHVFIHLGVGPHLRHSLCNPPAQGDRYILAAEDGDSPYGGSSRLVGQMHVGSIVRCSPPGNTFSLADRAPSFLFIAEGMGIAPIISMVRHIAHAGERPFQLYYSTPDEEATPFREALAAAAWRDRVVVHHDHGDPERALDLWPILERPTGAHVYCCGRRPMLESVRDMTGHWPTSRVHFETIGGADETRSADDHGFRVRLARSGTIVEVAADQTVLDALRSAGHDVPSSCESGTCGTCRTRLLEGLADHRDLVLGDDERDDYIMVCVSRALTSELTIDR